MMTKLPHGAEAAAGLGGHWVMETPGETWSAQQVTEHSGPTEAEKESSLGLLSKMWFGLRVAFC